jgi:hypothetical protein
MGLHEVMGCREEHVQTGVGGRTELHWDSDLIPGMKRGDVIPARWYEETLAPVGSGSTVVARFADGRPAAIVSSYGKGKTLMLGSYLSAAFQNRASETARRFFTGLLQWAGVRPPVRISNGEIEVQILEAGNDRLLFAFNHGKQALSPTIRLVNAPGIATGRDLIADSEVPVTVDGNSASARGSILPGHVWVVHISGNKGQATVSPRSADELATGQAVPTSAGTR